MILVGFSVISISMWCTIAVLGMLFHFIVCLIMWFLCAMLSSCECLWIKKDFKNSSWVAMKSTKEVCELVHFNNHENHSFHLYFTFTFHNFNNSPLIPITVWTRVTHLMTIINKFVINLVIGTKRCLKPSPSIATTQTQLKDEKTFQRLREVVSYQTIKPHLSYDLHTKR